MQVNVISSCHFALSLDHHDPAFQTKLFINDADPNNHQQEFKFTVYDSDDVHAPGK